MEKILLFIPMYNCEKQIVRVMDQIKGEINNYILEVIIVNNKSTDNGEEAVIKKLKNDSFDCRIKLLRNQENYGLGGSHKVAFNYAVENEFDYVIVLHGDDQGSVSDIIPILKNGIHKKYDCCLGCRFLPESKLQGYSKFRTFGNIVFNKIYSISTHRKIKDLGAGLNLYSTKMLATRFYHTFPDNLTFNCYMLFALNEYQQTNIFFPLTWREDDQVSNVKMVKQTWQTFKMAFMYFIKKGNYLSVDTREIKRENYKSTTIFEN